MNTTPVSGERITPPASAGMAQDPANTCGSG
jgi:hypothetical protein